MRCPGVVGGVQFDPTVAYPTANPGRIAEDQCVRRNVTGDDRTGANKGILTNGYSADDRAVGTQRGTLSHEGSSIFVLACNMAAGVDNVGEDHGWSAEYIVFKNHACVDGDIILNLYVVSNANVGRNNDILADVASRSDGATLHYMAEVPDLGVGPDLAGLINIAGWVCEVA